MSRHPLKVGSRTFLNRVGTEKTTQDYQDRQAIYSQGDAADAMFQIQNGNVKLVTASPRGKQAVIAILGPGDIFGEGAWRAKHCGYQRPQRFNSPRSPA